MKTKQVTVKFPEGLHLRVASRLIRLLQGFRSQIHLRCGQKVANGKSILNILLLGAAFNVELDVTASGEDEEEALRAVEVFFRQSASHTRPVTVQPVDFGPETQPPAALHMERRAGGVPRSIQKLKHAPADS